MGEIPAELDRRTPQSIPDSEGFNPYLRQYDVFIETTTQMLVTPKLHERLLLALEAVATVFGYQQSAIAVIDERDAVLRVRAAVGFGADPGITRIEMPLDSRAACVHVVHDAQTVWISPEKDDASRASSTRWFGRRCPGPALFGLPNCRSQAADICDDNWSELCSRLGPLRRRPT
jgi:hypothetical protein